MNRRPHSFRSRSVRVWSFAVYAAIQAAVLGMVLSLPWMREPIYGRKLVRLRSRLAKAADRPLTVAAFGSSRTLNALRGDLMEPTLARETGQTTVVFNMGIPGGGPVSNLLHLRRLLDDGIRPDVAIFEFLPHCLAEGAPQVEVKGEGWRIETLRRGELGLVRRYARDRSSPSRSGWCLAQSNPIYQHRFNLLTYTCPMILAPTNKQNDFDGIDAVGWFPVPEKPDAGVRQRATNAMLEQYQSRLKNMSPSTASLQPLHEALLLCRQRHITAVLLLMPEGPLFRSLYPPRLREQIRRLLVEAPKTWNVPIIDARDWFDDESAFIDSHHPYPKTAAAFSTRLGQELLSLPACIPQRKTGETR